MDRVTVACFMPPCSYTPKVLEEASAKLQYIKASYPPILTPRLTLRSFVLGDVYDVYAYASHSEVCKYLTFQAHTSLNDSYFFLLNVALPAYESNEIGPYALEFEGRVIGAVELRSLHSPIRTHVRELGVVLHHDFWGQGLMKEAVEAVLTYGFAHHAMMRVVASVDARNTSSKRLMHKLGFVLEGTERNGRFFNRELSDILHYGLLKQEQ